MVMWGLCGAIFTGFKLLTWRDATSHSKSATRFGAAIRYFLGWVGMDPRPFSVPAQR